MEVLERRLGLKAVIAIAVSSMLGPGIFVLPGVVAQDAGSGLWVSYLLAAILILPAALSKAELATAMPTSGGTYVYIERTFGPLIGTVAGLGLWLSLLFKTAFALIGIGAYLNIFGTFAVKESALAILAVIFFLNINGVGKISALLVLICTVCFTSMSGVSFWAMFSPDLSVSGTPLENGIPSIITSTATIFVAYAGVIKIAAIAEEIKDPNVNLPKGMIYSILIVSVLYIIVALGYMQVMPQLDGELDLKPIYTLGAVSGGELVGRILAGIAIFTMALMANAGVLAASRFPFAMARDNLLPSFLGKLSQKSLTPVTSIFVSCIIIVASMYALNVEALAKLASVFMIIMFVAVNITVIVLRESRVQWYKPGFRTKLYPALQSVGAISGMILLFSISQYFIWAFVAIAIPGLLIYFLYTRKRVNRKGVLGVRGTRKDLIEAEPEFQRNVEFPFSTDSSEREAKVVVSLYGKERSPDMLIELGIAVSDHCEVEVAHLTEVPEQTSVHDIEDSASVRSLARRIRTMARKNEVTIYFDPVTSHDIYATIHEISQRLHCTWLIREWGGWSRGTFTVHNQVGWLEEHLDCHLVTFKDAGIRYFRKILVYISKDELSRLSIDFAAHLARVHDASVTIVSFIDENDETRVLEDVRSRLSDIAKSVKVPTSISVIQADDKLEAVVNLSVEYDLLIVGDEKQPSKYKRWFGVRDIDKLMAKSACSVISLKESKSIANN